MKKKPHSKYWDFVQELMDSVANGDIDDQDHIDFITSLYDNLDPYQPEEELSERQLLWLVWLWNKYCNDDDQDFEWED